MQEIHKIMIEMQTKYQVPFDTSHVTIRLLSNSLTTSPTQAWGGEKAVNGISISKVKNRLAEAS